MLVDAAKPAEIIGERADQHADPDRRHAAAKTDPIDPIAFVRTIASPYHEPKSFVRLSAGPQRHDDECGAVFLRRRQFDLRRRHASDRGNPGEDHDTRCSAASHRGAGNRRGVSFSVYRASRATSLWALNLRSPPVSASPIRDNAVDDASDVVEVQTPSTVLSAVAVADGLCAMARRSAGPNRGRLAADRQRAPIAAGISANDRSRDFLTRRIGGTDSIEARIMKRAAVERSRSGPRQPRSVARPARQEWIRILAGRPPASFGQLHSLSRSRLWRCCG